VVKNSIEIKRAPEKEPGALDETPFARIDRKFPLFPETPRPTGRTKLKGYKDPWRIKAGERHVPFVVHYRRRRETGHRDLSGALASSLQILMVLWLEL
jgi:hypothetical protein